MNWRTTLRKSLRNPRQAWIVGFSYLRGWYYRIKFRLLGRRVTIGKRFRVQGRLDIRGPGRVIFGDDCGVVSSHLQVTTPWTHTPEAVIHFGNHVWLTGTRIGCGHRIDVGDYAGLADTRIMDTDFHPVESPGGHRYQVSGRSKPVKIGKNTWLAAGSMVLKGVTIGDNAVVGAGAVVLSNVPENAVVMGNPARVIWRIRRSSAPSESKAGTSAPEPAGAAQGKER